MVKTPIKQSASSERQKVIDWLKAHNYPALPVAPAQSAWKYPKVAQEKSEQGIRLYCPLEPVTLQPIPLYTGKNPSYLDRRGCPHLINHRQYQKRLPNKYELNAWFANPLNGVGTLGGWNDTVWLDFDVKQFHDQLACDAAVKALVECTGLQQTFIERSHSGGWRIGVKVKQKPNFTNFSLTPNGPHVGEALYSGRFTVLAPTIGPSGNPYQSIIRTQPIEVENLLTIGIYPTGKNRVKPASISSKPSQGENRPAAPAELAQPIVAPPENSFIPGSIPLELLGNQTATQTLQGNCPTKDRSFTLTAAIREWYGWENWTRENGIPTSGTVEALAHYAGLELGINSDRINRILQTIDPTSCQPAALHCGGAESCWKKVRRISQAILEHQCPNPIQDPLVSETEASNSQLPHPQGDAVSTPKESYEKLNVGSSNVESSHPQPSTLHRQLTSQIKQILSQDLPPSELIARKIRLRSDNPGVSERELSQLFETLEQEIELEESRQHRRSEVDNLLKLGDQSLNLQEFLPTDLAQPLENLAFSLNIRPEVCLTSLLVAASSLHKTQTELVIHRGNSFSVPPTIFAGLVSESGQKKSPILKAIIRKPLSVLQREQREAFEQAQAKYDRDITDWDKCKSEERQSKFPNGKPKKPQQRLYYFTNATGEGLLYQFQAHPDKALLALVDELVGLFASQNKYSGGRGSDRQDILSAFDGTGATLLRASGTKADIDGVLLSIFGTIQPEILKRLMKDCSDPDGQWARFLFVNQPLAAATLKDDDGNGIDLTEHLLNYYRAIDQLPVQQYRLSAEAFKRYQPVYNQLEKLRVSHPNPGMRSVYSKMEGYIGRLALNLHVLHELSRGKTVPMNEIPLSIMELAIALAKFYAGQVQLIHANCAADLSDTAPHLAKIVELSKRMDATTGNSWIKAKIVQSGYDSHHRPRPDGVRSWFRELEALGIGATRGAGIRLEYSWKLPNLPFDDSDPPPQRKVEKSGEKWITSPPTETPPIQGIPTKEEKVDSSPHLQQTQVRHIKDKQEDEAVAELVCPVGELVELEPCRRVEALKPQDENSILEPLSMIGEPSVQPLSMIEEPSVQPWAFPLESWVAQLWVPQTENSLKNTSSTSPLSGCDHASAPVEVVDKVSTFSPPAATLSTFPNSEEPESQLPEEQATITTISQEFLAQLAVKGTKLLALLTPVMIQDDHLFEVELLAVVPTPPDVAEPAATETDAEVDPVKVGSRVYWSNCPAHCEQFAPFEIISIDGNYAKLDLFKKPVLLTELYCS